jgi:acetoin utilization deacetylase AcuC-like enzyme
VGSRGTWEAAVCGVAAAIAGAEMVINGESVNAFCATRPPGHHAGRNLHPMKAVSNGFCVLNAVAAAAIFATLPLCEGGLGLSKVCVIDFDAHHGNGTQDILCSTFDSRFLYVSLHAGGPEVNGVAREEDDDPNHELHDLATNKSGGIYPGRCGDTSPHKGVVNIPLGARVTAHDVGNALIQVVSPAVESFSPDLIILSAGFDAHKNDPMGLGSLSAQDFGHITEVACQLAFKTCSGRVLSVLEGGYGVPCCRPQRDDVFLPTPQPSHLNGASTHFSTRDESNQSNGNAVSSLPTPDAPRVSKRPQPSQLLDLGADLPDNMDDQVPYGLQKRLEKCHAEGFVQCVQKHVESLSRCNRRK